jgi:hypothetical protein
MKSNSPRIILDVTSLAILGIASLAILLTGCSFSYSSKSSSASSRSSSSSGSSSPEDAYKADIGDFTAANIQSGGTVDDLRREIGKLAKKHGVTDWESSKLTFEGVGGGLAKAGLKQVGVDAYKQNLTNTAEQAQWMQKGYDSAR